MSDSITQSPMPTPSTSPQSLTDKDRPGNVGGKKKIDPSVKEENKKKYDSNYKRLHHPWQAYFSPHIIEKLNKVMKDKGFKNKEQLIEWLLRNERF